MKEGADENLMNRWKPLLLISYRDEMRDFHYAVMGMHPLKRKRRKKLTKLHVTRTIYIVFSTFFISTC